jgi:hypothetical protein
MPFAPVQPTVDSELWSAIANATSDGIFSAAPMRPGPFETLVALEEGAATLGGLTPGVELELTAVDALLQPLATQRVVTPRAGERADVELRVADAQRPRGRAGRVVDASGRGLPRAEVRLDKDFFDDRVDFTVTTETGSSNGESKRLRITRGKTCAPSPIYPPSSCPAPIWPTTCSISASPRKHARRWANSA